ncbi:PREDICTED: ammonium transporter 3 member 1-like [Erythranthe guttata]|uniref:ammonium transporter 3 member 1-like n=1 Tax=Erythranthe guttata TaxID=4155 RepID=UPI00064DB65F|nr:PREDICTED: ammonium transporter 3 member 1-like [Erythranthe guttata]|eukprot:XP_012849839.1 PREDICTED: ammonium transporter 3 member 1-like [Erythranthe guttata]
MVVHKKLWLLHTHAVAGYLGGILTGIFAEPVLCSIFLPITNSRSSVYGGVQVFKQIMGGGFIIGWNVVVTSVICVLISFVVQLRMPEKELLIGDDAVHGEEAYALWGDGERSTIPRSTAACRMICHRRLLSTGRRRRWYIYVLHDEMLLMVFTFLPL